jgi:hypothetical protein
MISIRTRTAGSRSDAAVVGRGRDRACGSSAGDIGELREIGELRAGGRGPGARGCSAATQLGARRSTHCLAAVQLYTGTCTLFVSLAFPFRRDAHSQAAAAAQPTAVACTPRGVHALRVCAAENRTPSGDTICRSETLHTCAIIESPCLGECMHSDSVTAHGSPATPLPPHAYVCYY